MERVARPVGEASVEREAVIRALDNCYDPCCSDRRISVVDMGLIESIEILEARVRIEMVLTSGWCPFAARLVDMMQEEVGGLAGVDAVDVEVVWDPTWTPGRMSAGAREKLSSGAIVAALRGSPVPRPCRAARFAARHRAATAW